MKRGDLNSLSSPHDRLIVTRNIEYVNEVGHRSRSTGLIFRQKPQRCRKCWPRLPARCTPVRSMETLIRCIIRFATRLDGHRKAPSSRANRRRHKRRKRWEKAGRSCKPLKMNESLPRSLFTFHVRRAAKATTIQPAVDSTTAEKLASWNRPSSFSRRKRERPSPRRRRARARRDFKTVNHRPYTPRMTARVGKRESKEKLGGKKRRSGRDKWVNR